MGKRNYGFCCGLTLFVVWFKCHTIDFFRIVGKHLGKRCFPSFSYPAVRRDCVATMRERETIYPDCQVKTSIADSYTYDNTSYQKAISSTAVQKALGLNTVHLISYHMHMEFLLWNCMDLIWKTRILLKWIRFKKLSVWSSSVKDMMLLLKHRS